MLVKLNVGGTFFWTTRETLTTQGPHMLSAMIQHANPALLIDDAYFIDRDPNAFRWILNYLRGSKVLPPKESSEMNLLREEAQYYAIDNLLLRIQHMLCPTFGKNDHVLVRGSKFTIVEVEETSYLVTRTGKKFRIDASENIEPAVLEVGDVVMGWHKPSHKRLPGVCMALLNRVCTIQFKGQGGQEDCPVSGVRF